MRITRSIYNYSKSIFFLFLMSGLFLQSVSSIGQEAKKKKKRKPQFEVAFRLGVLYDDNILKYSDQYLNRFMNGEDKGRFHIETYDDAIFITGLDAASTLRIFKKRKTIFNASFARRTYAVNSIKDWKYFAVGVRQYLPWRTSFKVLYSYIPSFYVRHFRDDIWVDNYGYTPLSFQPYVFSKDNLGFWIQKYFFKGSRLKLSYYHSIYYHNKYYTEYDSKNDMYGIQFYQRLHKNFRINLGYYYVTSDAKGYDAAVDTPETTNGPDATFVEERFNFGFQYKFPNIKKVRHNFDFQATMFNRYYSSTHPWQTDPLHAGRYDYNLRFLGGYNVAVSKSVSLKVFYNWLGRNSESTAPNTRYVSNEKDYRQNIYGVEMIYRIGF